MKKTLFLLLFAIAFSAASAQVNYYEGRDTLQIGNEVYRIRRYPNYNHLMIISNVKAPENGYALYKDGTPVPPEGARFLFENYEDNAQLLRAARETFTREEIVALRNEDITVGYHVLPDGTITYLQFWITKTPASCSIPPERWATLEKKIMQYDKIQISGAEEFQYVTPMRGLYFKDVCNE